MESIAIAVAETFEFLQPFCSVAMRRQAAFESAPLKEDGSNLTLATETDMTAERHEASVARVHYLQERCDTSLTSSISEDEMLLPYDPSFNTSVPPVASPVPETLTFFTPRRRETQLSGLSLQWHVRRAVGGYKGIDLWHGFLCEEADTREDTGGFLGQVSCYRISPSFQLPTTTEERHDLEAIHPLLAALSQYMTNNMTLPSTSSLEFEKPLFGLPVVLVTDVQVSQEHRGMGLGLLLVDETCRCLANPAQWVLLATQEQALCDYFGFLGFTASALLDGQVIIRWNDPYCMATHRYEDLCPHLPRVAIQ